MEKVFVVKKTKASEVDVVVEPIKDTVINENDNINVVK